MDYVHPKYNERSIAAQHRWSEISSVDRRTHFAGAYWNYGFHEDGLVSGLRVARALGAKW
jgi:predicted NAD/FAD-binding protein